MISLLTQIVNQFVCWIETAAIAVLNAIISTFAVIISGLVAVMPDMPTLPSVPDAVTQGDKYVSYFFPVSFTVTLIVTLVGLWVSWIGVAIALRWAKILRGNS